MERYNTTTNRAQTAAQSAEYDEGLRAYMLKVYNLMASGVLLTGLVALFIANNETAKSLFYIEQMTSHGMRLGYTILGWIAVLAPLGMVFFMGSRIPQMSVRGAQNFFWAFSTLFGISLASIFFVYTDVSIARTFFISAASFGALSLYGYTTKKNLSGWGTFLYMGLFGIILAYVVNWFLQSPMLYFVTSAVGVLVFAGLTAYDTQKIKDSYYLMPNGEAAEKGAVMGALSLYLDFINLFLMLLRLMGDRR